VKNGDAHTVRGVRIAVFTGSQSGPPTHARAAATLATELAGAGLGIVDGHLTASLPKEGLDYRRLAGGEEL